MRLLLSFLAIGFVCVTATANNTVTKNVEVISEETVELANGSYRLKSVCIAATSYSSPAAMKFCQDDAATINLLSTDDVLMSASCNPDGYPSRCTDINSYLLNVRMSIFN